MIVVPARFLAASGLAFPDPHPLDPSKLIEMVADDFDHGECTNLSVSFIPLRKRYRNQTSQGPMFRDSSLTSHTKRNADEDGEDAGDKEIKDAEAGCGAT